MKSQKEIEEQIDEAVNSTENLSGMTYQQGVEYALAWVIGEIPEAPMD